MLFYILITYFYFHLLPTASARAHKSLSFFSKRTSGPPSLIDQAIDPEGVYSTCRIFGVQSIIQGNNLYVVGGGTWFTSAGADDEKFDGSNRRIFWIDLGTSFRGQSYVINSAEKPDHINGYPNLVNGALFSSGRKLLQYGGSFPDSNLTDAGYIADLEMFNRDALSTFDTSSESWSITAFGGEALLRPELGSSLYVENIGLGFYLGGIDRPFDDSQRFYALNQLLIFNSTSMRWTNESIDFDSRIRGNTVYLPVGKKGVLVNLAGQSYPGNYPKPITTPLVVTNVTFDSVKIYDIDGHRWYDQATTPDPVAANTRTPGARGVLRDGYPSGRQFSCSVVASAPDNSSHNIYMFGGLDDDGAAQRDPFQEVWVLSIPSFQWILVQTGTFGVWEARCHLAGGNQAIVVGGNGLIKSDGSGDCVEPFHVFHLEKLEWTSDFIAGKNDYKVPKAIYSVIGGGPDGGTTMKSPINGFQQENLTEIFNITALSTSGAPYDGDSEVSPTSRTGTPNSSDSTGVPVGVIVGSILGAITALGITIIAVTFFVIRRRKSKKTQANEYSTRTELPVYRGHAHKTENDVEFENHEPGERYELHGLQLQPHHNPPQHRYELQS